MMIIIIIIMTIITKIKKCISRYFKFLFNGQKEINEKSMSELPTDDHIVYILILLYR